MSTLLEARTPLIIAVANGQVALPPFRVDAGEWLLLRPAHEELGPDPAIAIASVLAALDSPLRGRVELFGRPADELGYAELSRVRRLLALVPSSGGLLANRTLRENIALPISVHKALRQAAEQAEVTAILQRFELLAAADLHPHQVSGGTRLRTCVARATSLSPALFVVEGAGEFVSASHVGLSWTRLLEEKQRGAALVVCLTRDDEELESWFQAAGGRVQSYSIRGDHHIEEERSR